MRPTGRAWKKKEENKQTARAGRRASICATEPRSVALRTAQTASFLIESSVLADWSSRTSGGMRRASNTAWRERWRSFVFNRLPTELMTTSPTGQACVKPARVVAHLDLRLVPRDHVRDDPADLLADRLLRAPQQRVQVRQHARVDHHLCLRVVAADDVPDRAQRGRLHVGRRVAQQLDEPPRDASRGGGWGRARPRTTTG